MKNESVIPEEIDKIIHEPARLKIILCLSVLRDADFNYLLYKTKLSRGISLYSFRNWKLRTISRLKSNSSTGCLVHWHHSPIKAEKL
jgi:ribosomal protein L2